MDDNKMMVKVPVALKGGGNYLLWSRLVKTAVGRLGLWNHITDDGPEPVAKEGEEGEEGKALSKAEAKKWVQEDLMVLSVLQGSLEVPILEAYSYCETPKHLWETLQKTFGNVSNLTRVFELKRAINTLAQEDVELTKHMGKFKSMWSELESLRPSTTDQALLMERREQDQVFGLLMTLNPCYKDVIKHILRSPSLPSMEEMMAQLQKEEGSLGLFGGKGELSMAHQAEEMQANKAGYGSEDRRPRERFSGSSSGAGPSAQVGESEGKALASHHSGGKSVDQDVIKKSDIEALIRALKESGNKLGNTLGYSYTAYRMSSETDRLLDLIKSSYPEHSSVHCSDKWLGLIESLKETPRTHIATSMHKPLIIDSGASHHMISDSKLIREIVPAQGHVMIANGDRIPIRGIGKLKLFDKESNAFFMPEFTSNLLS
ncbi:uncharacterized protein LOC108836836, partial [Raphanus sativus]|uniref:Uncharacterized protein LOC108836836 n=1 Tax=Raphanus sativus TaxID=3726 RepID=A0A9W3CZS4_RAPSA